MGATAARDLRGTARALAGAGWAPSSTYRLQLTAAFGFRQAADLVPYFASLGVGALYFSPYFKAVPGTTSGYDATDPHQLNPELGTSADYDLLCSRLASAGIGHVIDVVPNHMGIARCANPYWADVLEHGRASRFADYFDIDWRPVKPELQGKVLLPTLGGFYGAELESGKLRLGYAAGRFHLEYRGCRFPTNAASWPLVLEHGLEALRAAAPEDEPELRAAIRLAADGEGEAASRRLAALTRRSGAVRRHVEAALALFNGKDGDAGSFDMLDAFIGRQYYRLAHWRAASDEINYRRFFDVSDLAAVRMEEPEVFEFSHRLVFKLLEEGRVQGLRVDHPDGLYDPAAYFSRLQDGWLRRRLAKEGLPPEGIEAALADPEVRSAAPLFVVCEKILDRKEPLPSDWRVRGTVGYEALNSFDGVYVDRAGEKALEEAYEAFIGRRKDFEALIYEAKRFFLQGYMAGEIEALGHRLDTISETSRRYRDFTRRSLTAAVRETIACFPVYRTYVAPGDSAPSERDARYVRIAIARARKATPYLPSEVLDFLQSVLLLEIEPDLPEVEKPLYRDFVMRFQQLTGPAMAKGLEDTAFYVDHRLISLNEVGGDPGHFGASPSDFHRQNQERARRFPSGLLPASTHDTKRGSDVRLRINALSELAEEWKLEAGRWAKLNEKHKTELGGEPAPDRDAEYFLYQSLVGAWPDREPEGEARAAFVERMKAYALKSARQAKTRTDWINPHQEYEKALDRFVESILDPEKGAAFLALFRPFQRRAAEIGRLNALSQLALRLGAPGVVDVYQGDELWDLSLTDPDNRRPVDWDARAAALRTLDAPARELMAAREDGRVKLHVLRAGLAARRARPELFVGADYAPLRAEGPREEHALAFLRSAGRSRALAAGARLFAPLEPLRPELWEGTRLLLPADCAGRRFTDVLTGRALSPAPGAEGAYLPCDELFRILPCALLVEEAS